jgi:hemerythrin-like domain-containing protein
LIENGSKRTGGAKRIKNKENNQVFEVISEKYGKESKKVNDDEKRSIIKER